LGYSWGNHFDFVSRGGCNPAGSPIIVWTSLIGQAFLEGFEQTGDERYLDVAQGICRWILQLPREQTNNGACLSYVPFAQTSIHNSNMLGAAMLARTWKHTRQDELYEVAHSAMLYSCSRQCDDGSWWYGEDPKYYWVDNFHTGYNLDSLKRYIDCSGEDAFKDSFQSGLKYYRDVFFEPDGTPKYYHNKTYPIDIQCASQSIETLAYCSDNDPECLILSKKVAEWTINNMQDKDGYFYYRQFPVLKIKTPYIHWGQATMYKALATLLYVMK
jgi:rhamnogalacturonyl hydrolase YesR